jgi:glycosyltransferase involved in cell wall biosynthesis
VIKVANIIEDGRVAGPQVRMIEVAKKLNKKEFETVIIIPKKSSQSLKTRLIKNNITYKELSLHRLTKQKRQLFLFATLFIYEIFFLYRFLKNNNFNIVHVSGGIWQWKGVIAGKLAGCKVIWHLNDTSMPFFIKTVGGVIANIADGFIMAGKKTEDYYSDVVKVKGKIVKVIHAPVNFREFNTESVEPNPDIESFQGVKITTVANINPVKGLETFIKMANLLSEKHKNLVFFIVGPVFKEQSKYFDYLSTMIIKFNLKNIRFLGGDQDIKSILKSSDIYVCSSNSEASPVAVWEAMSMKVPVVSTDVGDVSLFLKDVVGVGNYREMAKSIEGFILNKEKAESVGDELRDIALINFDSSIIATLHEEIYKEVLGISKSHVY